MGSTTTPGTSSELVARIEGGWRALRDAIGAFPIGRFDEATAAGWTVKELVAHVAAWEATVPPRLASVAAGRGDPSGYEDLDAFNAEVVKRARARSAADVLRELDDAHDRLLHSVRALPAGPLDPLARDVVEWNTYGHYPEHRDELAASLPVRLDDERGLDGW